MSEQLESAEINESQGIYDNFFQYLETKEQLIPKQVRFNGFEILETSGAKDNKIKVDVFYNGQKCGYFFKQADEEGWNYVRINLQHEFEIQRNIF